MQPLKARIKELEKKSTEANAAQAKARDKIHESVRLDDMLSEFNLENQVALFDSTCLASSIPFR